MADNKDKKVLKSSIEREQNQTCLNSAEREKIKGSTNLNVPHLRFPEFSGEWESARLSSFTKKITKKNKGNVISNVLCNSANLGIIPQSEYFDRDIANTENTDTYYIIENGDFVYNPRKSVTAPYGPVNMYKGKNSGIISPLYLCFTVKDISKDFLLNWFKGNTWYRYVYSHGDTGVRYDRVSIKDDIFLNMPINIPVIGEQEKISKILNLLDERIATQNKIIEKLQSLIKGLRVCCMQRVYGNNVHLSEIAQIYQPQTISSTELTEDGFLVYGANGIIGKYKDYNHETEQICITCRGNTCGIVNYTKPMSWITGNAMVINTDKYQDKVYKRYLYHFLSAYNFNSIISGSGQPQIVRTPLEKLKITLPPISEQKQKAMILDRIQDKIDINHKVLNLYIRQKQYLLCQMFI